MFMQTISDVTGVKSFFRHLVKEERVNFHPDIDFRDYVCIETGKPTFTSTQAIWYSRLMRQAFTVCEKSGVSVYEVGTAALGLR